MPVATDWTQLPDWGDARRWSSTDGQEVWRVGSVEQAERLLAWGQMGVGGIDRGGIDVEGPWLQRRPVAAILSEVWRRPVNAGQAVTIVQGLASILAVCEAKSWFAGPLLPRHVVLEGNDVWWLAPFGVGAQLNATDLEPPQQTRWIAPEQAGGDAWNSAGDRYVLALILYRLLGGEHPFARLGLRRGWDAQRMGPPPLPPEVVNELPAGLASLTLRWLDPDPQRRPHSAATMLDELSRYREDSCNEDPYVERTRRESQPDRRGPEGLAQSSIAPHRSVEALQGARQISVEGTNGHARALDVPIGHGGRRSVVRGPSTGSSTGKDSPSPALQGRAWWLVLPFITGLAALWIPPTPSTSPSTKPVVVGSMQPLTRDSLRPDDCASCHPDQTGQWQASVMAHAVRSPLFQALEMVIQEQGGRSRTCPNGAGLLRPAEPQTACRDVSGLPITGSGGALWCVNCHSPGVNTSLAAGRSVPAWNGFAARSASRFPVRDLLSAGAMEGISCVTCHEVHGPVRPGDAARGDYEGNPDWVGTRTGTRFDARPEDALGRFGIANSGYAIDEARFLSITAIEGRPHQKPSPETAAYLRSSEFCGSCHDVRLFGTDARGVARGEHFKRLRNAYSEWVDWAAAERVQGRTPASCQDCHMSAFPGTCAPAELIDTAVPTDAVALQRACPPGWGFVRADPGERVEGSVATGAWAPISTHYFSGVDVPLSPDYPTDVVHEPGVDGHGIPRAVTARRDLLLGSTFRLDVDARSRGRGLEVDVELENIGAGHKVPAGFSQEREIWVHLRVTDARGRVIYEVGRVDREDEDLHDKRISANVDDGQTDGLGRPLGVFGADVVDGPDVPQWRGAGEQWRGRGLINLQNGFLRCVQCRRGVGPDGRCVTIPGVDVRRADPFEDGDYDPESGACISDLVGEDRFLEVYFPVGSLDARRGVFKGPDAIVDDRSLAPGRPRTYTYELSRGGEGPLTVEARLLFRAFPPFLLRAFIAYEAAATAAGRRPSGPLIDERALERLEVVELHRIVRTVP